MAFFFRNLSALVSLFVRSHSRSISSEVSKKKPQSFKQCSYAFLSCRRCTVRHWWNNHAQPLYTDEVTLREPPKRPKKATLALWGVLRAWERQLPMTLSCVEKMLDFRISIYYLRCFMWFHLYCGDYSDGANARPSGLPANPWLMSCRQRACHHAAQVVQIVAATIGWLIPQNRNKKRNQQRHKSAENTQESWVPTEAGSKDKQIAVRVKKRSETKWNELIKRNRTPWGMAWQREWTQEMWWVYFLELLGWSCCQGLWLESCT